MDTIPRTQVMRKLKKYQLTSGIQHQILQTHIMYGRH